MSKRIRMLSFLAVFIISSVGHDGIYAWQGQVVGVADGDTITILSPDKRQIHIRLYGVDCPEGGQDFGSRAKQFTSSKVFGKTVEIDPMDTDAYGRTVAIVKVDGANLSQMLVESGMAWVFDKYCKMMPDCGDWRQRQEDAKNKRNGLWSGSNPTPPWDYRHAKPKSNMDPNTVQRSSNALINIPNYRVRDPSVFYDLGPMESYGTSSSQNSAGSGGGRVWVDSYQRKDGTPVKGYWRSK